MPVEKATEGERERVLMRASSKSNLDNTPVFPGLVETAQ
jgi:hypothetical protein